MAPGGGGKRKRQDRPYAQDEGQGRPSPHRPESMPLAQYGQRHDGRGGGGAGGRRRGSKGGPNGYGQHDNHRSSANASSSPSRGTPTVRSPNRAPDASSQQGSRPPPAAATRPMASHAPAPSREDSPLADPPFPFAYEYLTDEMIGNWQDSGRQTWVDTLSRVDDEDTASIMLQELQRSAIDRRLHPALAGSAFREAVNDRDAAAPFDLESVVVDIVQMTEPADWKRHSFTTFLFSTGIPVDVWRKTLEFATLIDAGFVSNSFKTTLGRKTTNILYRQQNYNLLREESEGYAS